MIIIYTTLPTQEAALKIGAELIEKKLVTCANFHQVTSMFRWKGKLNMGPEFALTLKTHVSKYPEIEALLKKIHPYEIPCIIRYNVSANAPFEQWITDELV